MWKGDGLHTAVPSTDGEDAAARCTVSSLGIIGIIINLVSLFFLVCGPHRICHSRKFWSNNYWKGLNGAASSVPVQRLG